MRHLSQRLVAAALLATPAAAEPPPEAPFTGSLELGIYRSTEDSYAFGQYTGIKDDGWYPLANFDVEGRAPWNSGDTWNFRAQGLNLGLDSRFLDARGGMQGLFSVYLQYQEIPDYGADSTSTIFSGRGTGFLSLPPGWVPATGTSGFTALGTSLDHITFSTLRRDARAGVGLVLPRGWEFTTDYEYEKKEGRAQTAAVIGNTGGNPRAALVAEPIDWRTNEVDAALRYAGDEAQLELGYEFSGFDDYEDSLTWQNPYLAISGWNPVAGYPTGVGRKALPPDNVFHQFKASGGYDLPWQTRIAANAAFGFMRQNDDFLPYTVNPGLSVTTPLPRHDADGQIDTTNLGLRITSRPLPKLRLSADYRFDDRDNDTPRDDIFIYVPGDSLDQDTVDSERARINLPNSYRLHAGRFDVGYDVVEKTELTAGYERRHIERSWTEVDQTDENIYRLGARARPLRQIDMRVDYAHITRNAGDYFSNAPLAWGFSPEYLASGDAPPFENLPGLRKYNLADLERNQVDTRLRVAPLERVGLGFHFGWAGESYEDSEFGLRSRRARTWTVDGSWSPIDAVTTYAYFTRENFATRIRARAFNGGANLIPQSNDPERNWRQHDLDSIDSVGLGAEWTLLGDALSLRMDYAYSRAEDSIDVRKGPALTPRPKPFPNATTKLHDVSVQAEYQIREDLKARVAYLFQYENTKDWAYDDVAPATLNEVLTLGQQPSDYQAHLFGLSLEYGF